MEVLKCLGPHHNPIQLYLKLAKHISSCQKRQNILISYPRFGWLHCGSWDVSLSELLALFERLCPLCLSEARKRQSVSQAQVTHLLWHFCHCWSVGCSFYSIPYSLVRGWRGKMEKLLAGILQPHHLGTCCWVFVPHLKSSFQHLPSWRLISAAHYQLHPCFTPRPPLPSFVDFCLTLT